MRELANECAKAYSGVGRLGCKLVFFLSLLVKEEHHAIHSTNSQFAVVGGPRHRHHLRCPLLEEQGGEF